MEGQNDMSGKVSGSEHAMLANAHRHHARSPLTKPLVCYGGAGELFSIKTSCELKKVEKHGKLLPSHLSLGFVLGEKTESSSMIANTQESGRLGKT